MEYARPSPAELATAMSEAGRSRPAYRPVRRGGAEKAAAMLTGLLTGPRG